MTRTKYKVCPNCEGSGTTVNPSIDGNGLSWEDFDEAGPEFVEDYFSGVYDVACAECEGNRVIEDSPEAEEQRAYEAERAYEIRMGY
jgi:hypothetical protein